MKIDPATRYHSESSADVADDFPRYEKLFADNEMPREDGSLEWRYSENPAGQFSTVNFAVENESGAVGAIYASMGVKLRFEGKIVGGAQSLDSLTDVNHRRRGLFPFLGNSHYEVAHPKGVTLVYGFPNDNALPPRQKHLGWKIYGNLDILFRPLRTGYFAERVLGKIGVGALGRKIDFRLPARIPKLAGQLDVVRRFNDEHAAIWEKAAKDVTIGVDRSADYLNWRIFGRPDGEKYKVMEYSEDGRKLGFVIWCVEQKHGGRIGYLMECLCDPERPDVCRNLLQLANARMSDSGADLVLAWVPPHSPGATAFRKSGYHPLPTSLRPTQLYWGMRRLDAGPAFSKTDWYISYLDSDTV